MSRDGMEFNMKYVNKFKNSQSASPHCTTIFKGASYKLISEAIIYLVVYRKLYNLFA